VGLEAVSKRGVDLGRQSGTDSSGRHAPDQLDDGIELSPATNAAQRFGRRLESGGAEGVQQRDPDPSRGGDRGSRHVEDDEGRLHDQVCPETSVPT
jgi:hypothetical protein